MSRYKVSRYIGLTPQVYDVIGPDNQVIARMWSSNEEEVAHLARFIEAHDDIIDILSDAAYDYGDQAINLNEMRALLKRLDQLARAGLVEPIEMRTLLNRLDLLASAGLVEPPDLIEMHAMLKRLDVYSDKLNEYEKAKAGCAQGTIGQGGATKHKGEAI